MEDEKLPFTQHLEELRKRLIICIATVFVGFILSYAFSQQLFEFLAEPAKPFLKDGDSFIYTGLTEGFFTYLKLALFAGIFLACPVIFYQIWCFVAPGLYQHEKKYALPFLVLSTLFFIAGASFCYFVVFPIACKFFSTYANEFIRMNLKLNEYLTFSCKLILAFGIIFELPIFVLFLAKLGIVNAAQLRSNRKFVLVGVFVIAAFLTPPDVVSQVLMALPLIVLYEISIIVAGLFGRKKQESLEEEDDEEESEEDDTTK